MGKQLQDLLPPNLVTHCYEQHVRVRLASVPGDCFAMYHNESDEIILDPNIDVEFAAQRLTKDLEIKVEVGAVFVVLLFHELAHREMRTNYEGLPLLAALAEKRENEIRADRYTIKRFWDWKCDTFQQFHYRKWLREKVP